MSLIEYGGGKLNNKMRITCIAITLLAAISVSCAETAETTVTRLSDNEVLDLYYEAREAYAWFDLKTILDTGKSIEFDGVEYYEVAQPGITSKKALTDYLNGIFADKITEGLMNAMPNRYMERGGKLYVLLMHRGSDIFKGEETYEVARVSEEQIKLTVTVEIYGQEDIMQRKVVGYKQYDYLLEWSGNRWRFKNFELVR